MPTPGAEEIYDLVVIGGGSGGSAVARRAAGYGAKVCLVDKGPTRDAAGRRTGAGFGGTCVNVGCVPKKLMYLASSEREHLLAGHLSGYGVSANASGAVDWAALKERRDAYVAMLNKSYESNWTKAGIDIAVGEATFEGPHSVRVTPLVSQGAARGVVRLLSASKVVIAVGGAPAPLDVPGGELAISSDGFFDLPSRPKKVAVIGAGYIAVELAGILHGLGSETHLFFRGPTVLQHGFVRASTHRPTLSFSLARARGRLIRLSAVRLACAGCIHRRDSHGGDGQARAEAECSLDTGRSVPRVGRHDHAAGAHADGHGRGPRGL